MKQTKADQPQENKGNKWVTYLRNLGVVGFMFFFIKGLAWIAVFALGAKGCNALTG